MEANSVKGSITIDASPQCVWKVLTEPDQIVQYTGSATITDWKIGSSVLWEGEMGGTRYRNKGTVLENIAEKILSFTYWSGFGGILDLPENYSTITYTITKLGNDKTELTYAREKIPSIEERNLFHEHLPWMLMEIKRLAERCRPSLA